MSRSQGVFGYGSTVREFHDNPSQQYSDDPDFENRGQPSQNSYSGLTDAISRNMFRINNNAGTLEQVLKQIGTNRDSVELREKVHETEKRTNEVIVETTNLFKQLSVICGKGDRAKKIQFDRLMGEFKEITQKYHTLQKKVADRVKLSAPVQSSTRAATGPDLIGWNEPSDSDGQSSLLVEQRRQQAQLQAEATEVDVALLREREEQIRQLEGDIVDINQIFRELGVMVHEQGAVIDTIEANVESAHSDVEAGTAQLQRAATYQNRARKKKCCIIAIVLVVLAIIVIIIVVSVKTHK